LKAIDDYYYNRYLLSIIIDYYSWLQRSGGKPRIRKLRWPAMRRASG